MISLNAFTQILSPSLSLITFSLLTHPLITHPLIFPGAQRVAMNLPKKELYEGMLPLLDRGEGAMYVLEVTS